MEQIDFTPQGLLDKIERTITVPFQRFEKYTSDFGIEHLYCFVEGHDLPYYNVRVEAISGKQCSFVYSGGKKNVIALHEMLKGKKEYAKYKTLYFVDRDYDDNSMLNQAIYVTPCYSVENLYLSENIVDKLLCIQPEYESYQKCKKFIDDKMTEFLGAIIDFCAWYYCVKQKEQIDHTTNLVCLEDSINSRLVEISVTLEGIVISRHYTLEQLNETYNTGITQDELNLGVNYIKKDIYKNVRGKYIFQFIEKLLNYLNMDSSNKGHKFFLKKPISFNSDRKKMMASLTNIALTPIELKQYINKIVA